MVTFRTRGRRWWLGGAIAAALVASLAALLLRPMLEHAVRARIGLMLADSYHCSRYNTNTGRLTTRMFHDVFDTIRAALP